MSLETREDLSGIVANQSIYKGGRYIEGLATDEVEAEEINYLENIHGVGHVVNKSKDTISDGSPKSIHEQAHDTAHKLIQTIPAIIIGALVFIIVIGAFDMIRIYYEDIVINRTNNFKSFRARLPLFLLNLVLAILLIIAIISYFNNKW